MMKIIETHGIWVEPLEGSSKWYWGSDYVQGDLYEAEELFADKHPVICNRLVFVHDPDGHVVEPIKGKAGQYFGRPISYNGKIQILLVDFMEEIICIFQYDDVADQVHPVVSLPLSEVEDCYNLLLHSSPLLLTRQQGDGKFQIIWPERVEFTIGQTETFLERKDDKLYFSRWYEQPDGADYREEVVVRKYPTGEVLEVIPGFWLKMPNGQTWVLQ